MSKKVNDVVKAFGNNIEEAAKKLQVKFQGFCILHPEFEGANLEFDAGTFVKDGKTMAWAKLYQTIEVEDEPIVSHPEVAKKSAKKSRKAKVA